MEEYILVRPTDVYAEQIVQYRKEFLDNGDSMDGCGSLRTLENPYKFIEKCKKCEDINTLPDGKVVATQFLFIRKNDNKVLGMIQVRHYFNDYLSKFGGHIGYSVRPSERKKGYAKEMLNRALEFCREINLEKVLITCIDTNIGSEKTILANGGTYESTIYEPNECINLKRYWISLSKAKNEHRKSLAN